MNSTRRGATRGAGSQRVGRPIRSPQALKAAFAVALGAGVLFHGGPRPADTVGAHDVAPGGITLVADETDESSVDGGEAGGGDQEEQRSEVSANEVSQSSQDGGSEADRAEGGAQDDDSSLSGSTETGADAEDAEDAATGEAGTSGDVSPGTTVPAPAADGPAPQTDTEATPPTPVGVGGPAATDPAPPTPVTAPITGAPTSGLDVTSHVTDGGPDGGPDETATPGTDPARAAVERFVDELTASVAGPVADGTAALVGFLGLGPDGPAEPGPAAALLLAAMARRGQGTLTSGPSAARRGQVGDAETALALADPPVSGSVTTLFPGQLVEVVPGPDGTTLYVVSQEYDEVTGETTTYVSVVDTTQPGAAPTTVGGSGTPREIVPHPNGTVTVVTYSYDDATDSYSTHITVVDPAAPDSGPVHTVPGYAYRILTGADGTVTVVSSEYDADTQEATTFVTTIGPADITDAPVTHTFPGSPHEVRQAPDGTVTVISGEYDTSTGAASTYVTFLGADLVPVTTVIPGSWRQTTSGPGDTLVIIAESYDRATENSTTHLAVVDPAAPAATPVVTTFPGRLYRLEAQPDGTTAVVTYDQVGNTFTTHVAFVDPSDPTAPRAGVTLPGLFERIEPGPDGTTTVISEAGSSWDNTSVTHVAFVDPGDPDATPVVATLAGRLDRIEAGPDGTAVLLTYAYDRRANVTTTRAALIDTRDPNAVPISRSLLGGGPEIVRRTDGTLAVVTAAYDQATRTSATNIAVLDPDDPNAAITSLPGSRYPVETADGTIVTFLYEYDEAAGTTRLTPFDLTDPEFGPAAETVTLRGSLRRIEPNADGTFTVFTSEYDATTYFVTTHIAVIDPDDASATRVLGTVPGRVDHIVPGAGGVLTVITRDDSGIDETTYIAVVDPGQPDAAPAVTTLRGRPQAVQSDADGTTTVVTYEYRPGTGSTSHIAVIRSDGAAPTVTSVPGVASLVDGAGGVRYAFVSDYASATTTIITINQPRPNTDPLTIPGQLSSYQAGPAGTWYLTTSTYDAESQNSRTDVFLFDPTAAGGPVITPLVSALPGSQNQLTVTPEGILTAVTYDYAGGSTHVTIVDTTDPGATPVTTTLPGYLSGVSTDADGLLTLITREYDSATGTERTHVAVIDTTDPNSIPGTTTSTGFYGLERVVGGPDRSVFVVFQEFDPDTGRSTTGVTVLRVLPGTTPNEPPAPGDGPVAGQPGADGSVVVDLGVDDPDGDALEVAVDPTDAPDPALGTVTTNPDGTVTYTPTAEARHDAARAAAIGGASVTDTFTVLVSDGRGGQVPVLVTVTIEPGNVAPSTPVVPPVAPVADRRRGGQVTGNAGIDDADGDDGDDLTYAVDEPAEHGTVTVDPASGDWTYVPTAAARAAAASGGATTDTFTLVVDDGHGGIVTVPVTVPISPNETPAATDDLALVTDPGTGAVTGGPIATDPEGDPLSFSVPEGSGPTRGTVVVDPVTGTFVYTPTDQARHDAAATGNDTVRTMAARTMAARVAAVDPTTDTFTVDVVDDAGLHTLVLVTVPITPANEGPTALPSPPATNPTTGVVTGDLRTTDADGDALEYAVGTAPARGVVEVGPDGRWTYTPTDAARRAAASGGPTTDAFTVRVSDGHGGSLEVSISVAIAPAIPTTPTTPRPDPKPDPKPRPCPPGTDHGKPTHHDHAHPRGQHESHHQQGHRRWVIDLVHHRAALAPAKSHATGTADRCPTVEVHSLDGRYLWVLDPATRTLEVVDTRTEKVIARLPVGAGAVGLALSADGSRLKVSHADGPDTVVDTMTLEVVGTAPAAALCGV